MSVGTKHGLAGARVLVTGAAGFIGRHLTRRLLAEECSVSGMVRSTPSLPLPAGVRQHAGDIRLKESVDHAVTDADPEFIVHLAANKSRTASAY